jgi:hypothetical protein
VPSASKRRSRPRKRAKRKSSREKVQAHRRRLRAQGLRPLQIWVPDTRSRRFASEARRQSLAVASSRDAAADQAFVAALAELDFE